MKTTRSLSLFLSFLKTPFFHFTRFFVTSLGLTLIFYIPGSVFFGFGSSDFLVAFRLGPSGVPLEALCINRF